jgi:hypothetical protein
MIRLIERHENEVMRQVETFARTKTVQLAKAIEKPSTFDRSILAGLPQKTSPKKPAPSQEI